MKIIDKKTLEQVGFTDTSFDDYSSKKVVLRDGRDAIVWVHKQTVSTPPSFYSA